MARISFFAIANTCQFIHHCHSIRIYGKGNICLMFIIHNVTGPYEKLIVVHRHSG